MNAYYGEQMKLKYLKRCEIMCKVKITKMCTSLSSDIYIYIYIYIYKKRDHNDDSK